MKLDTFFDNFGLLADAPNVVQMLRQAILQLAVQGKLVPQDPKDEPASVLLEKIKAEKERLIKENKIKDSKPLPSIVSDEMPFELPDGWEWLRLGEIGYWAIGSGFPKNVQGHTNLPILFCKVSDMNLPGNEVAINTTQNTVDEIILKKIKAKAHPPGTVVFPKIGGAIATNKRRLLIKLTAIDNNCLGIIPYESCRSDWLLLLLKSIDFTKYQSGTSVPAINQGTIELIVNGLPPLKEQKRIVAKIDELMALCDELEARKKQVSINCIQLNDASIHQLLTTREPKKFSKHWQRICDNFDLLYSKPENVNKLRQAILQLAVQGKLVPQDPKDEPASVLLEQIRAEKERLVREKKIKKAKPLPPIKSDAIPYELPNEWKWVRLGEISTLKSGSTINKNLEIGNENAGIPYIKVGAMNLAGNERTISVSNSYVKVTENLQKYIIPENSIIFPKRGGAIATNKKRIVSSDIFADSNVMAMIPNAPMRLDYLFCWFMHIDLWQLNSGTSVPQINNKDIAPLLFSLPSLNEQKRIVAKVDELMALCDELEASLSKLQTDCNRLMEVAAAGIMAA